MKAYSFYLCKVFLLSLWSFLVTAAEFSCYLCRDFLFLLQSFLQKLRKYLLTFRVIISRNFDVFAHWCEKLILTNSEENLGICEFLFFLLFVISLNFEKQFQELMDKFKIKLIRVTQTGPANYTVLWKRLKNIRKSLNIFQFWGISQKNGNSSKPVFEAFPRWDVSVLRRFHSTLKAIQNPGLDLGLSRRKDCFFGFKLLKSHLWTGSWTPWRFVKRRLPWYFFSQSSSMSIKPLLNVLLYFMYGTLLSQFTKTMPLNGYRQFA